MNKKLKTGLCIGGAVGAALAGGAVWWFTRPKTVMPPTSGLGLVMQTLAASAATSASPTTAALVARARTVNPDGSFSINRMDLTRMSQHDISAIEKATGANRAMLQYGYRSGGVPWLRR